VRFKVPLGRSTPVEQIGPTFRTLCRRLALARGLARRFRDVAAQALPTRREKLQAACDAKIARADRARRREISFVERRREELLKEYREKFETECARIRAHAASTGARDRLAKLELQQRRDLSEAELEYQAATERVRSRYRVGNEAMAGRRRSGAEE